MNKITMKFTSILTLILMSVAFNGWTKEPILQFQIAKDLVVDTELTELKSQLQVHEIEFFSPYNNKQKKYLGFAIEDLLAHLFGSHIKSVEFSHVAFVALDRYEAVAPLYRLAEKGGFLAFEDLDVESGWEPVGAKKADPAPFFLIWTGKNQTTANAYPWPWQVVRLRLLRFENQYPKVVPIGVEKDASVHRGFTIFRDRCLRCHAMDRQGGKIGPDLNAPQNITTYRSKHMIKEIIKHPSTYRHTQMPDHKDLTEQDLENLYLYLKHQGDNSTSNSNADHTD